MMTSPDDPPSALSPTEPAGNPALRMIVVNWALGALLGIAVAGALLVLDPIGLRALLMRSDAMVPGLVMLFVGFGTTFGGVVAATAVMFEKKEDDDDERGPPSGGPRRRVIRPLADHAPVPIPVRVRARRY